MKKVCYIFIFILMLFIYNQNVKAEEYTCKYTLKEPNGWGGTKISSIEYSVDEEKNKLDLPLRVGAIIDFAFDERYSDYVTCNGIRCDVDDYDAARKILINDVMAGNCARELYFCLGDVDDMIKSSDGILFDAQYISNIPSVDEIGKIQFLNANDFYRPVDVEKSCKIMEIDESGTTGTVVDKLEKDCVFYKKYIVHDDNGKIIGGKLKEKYDSCNNAANCLTEYNMMKDELKKYCVNTLKIGSYGMDPCVDNCLKLTDDLNSIEPYAFNKRPCNFSDKVILWIANIVKWIKYIIPVLVIIFGIMDFIKAIAAQSDDEMKKAQSRFIKRLIVAALVFIVPFLIEYVLSATHIVTDDPYCGII